MASATKITSALSAAFLAYSVFSHGAAAQTATIPQTCPQSSIDPGEQVMQALDKISNTLSHLELHLSDKQAVAQLKSKIPGATIREGLYRSYIDQYDKQITLHNEGGAYFGIDVTKRPDLLKDFSTSLSHYLTVLENIYQDRPVVKEALSALSAERRLLDGYPQNPQVASTCQPDMMNTKNQDRLPAADFPVIYAF